MAQVVEVLDDLHRKQFIYRRVSIHASGFFSLTKTLVCSCATLISLRDLKPENILIDADGYIKLCQSLRQVPTGYARQGYLYNAFIYIPCARLPITETWWLRCVHSYHR